MVFVPFCEKAAKEKQFQNAKDARAFIEGVIFDIPQSTWAGVIDNWFERMAKRVQAEGGFLRKTGVDRVVVSVVENPDCKT